MKKCKHCKEPNPQGWFYCRECGGKASDTMFTTNMYMMSAIGKRTDVEMSVQGIDQNTNEMKKRMYGN